MTARGLPKRSAFVGPPRSIYCDVPTEVMQRYLEALHTYEWTNTERPGGGVSSPPPSGAMNQPEGTA